MLSGDRHRSRRRWRYLLVVAGAGRHDRRRQEWSDRWTPTAAGPAPAGDFAASDPPMRAAAFSPGGRHRSDRSAPVVPFHIAERFSAQRRSQRRSRPTTWASNR
jgi:hypothetical protein